MKVAFWTFGKVKEDYLQKGINDYLGRLNRYLPLEYEEIKIPRSRKSEDSFKLQEAERDEVLKRLQPNDHLLLLDERGKMMDSVQLSQYVQQLMNSVSGRAIFLAGGPFGFHNEIKNRCRGFLSLSKMTFTHDMVRIIFLEQLYRAMTILRNEPYHH